MLQQFMLPRYAHPLQPSLTSDHDLYAVAAPPLWCERCLYWKIQRRCTVLPATAPHWTRDLHTLTLAGEEGALPPAIAALRVRVAHNSKDAIIRNINVSVSLTHYSGRVTQICVFNTVKTRYICKFSLVPLHKGECFQRYHTLKHY